jgi:hypothetical protein
MTTEVIRVEIPHKKFWDLAKHHDVHMNVSVFKTLREAGIPVDHGLELRGVTSGRLTMYNEINSGERMCVYEWQPPAPPKVDDDF